MDSAAERAIDSVIFNEAVPPLVLCGLLMWVNCYVIQEWKGGKLSSVFKIWPWREPPFFIFK